MTQEEFQTLVFRRFDQFDLRFNSLDSKIDKLETTVDKLETKVDAYWQASDRITRSGQWMVGLSHAMIAAATISILAFIAARVFGWVP